MAEVAQAYVTLLPSFQGFGRRVESGLGASLDRSGQASGRKFGAAFSGTAVKALGALGAGIAAGDFLKGAISQASDLNEAGTKTQAIFGKAGTALVDAFAGKGAKALGQTRLDVLDAAATFGTFGKAAGKTGPELAKFSTGLVGLSTDLASFFNTSPAEAAEAIAAGLRGEAEPLRRYGVLLDDASLRQEALRKGLIKTTKQALTPQQKVLAAQALIYKQTKDAQGDFERTSGGLANQQRILDAQFTNLKGTIGKAFLPAVTTGVTALNSLLNNLDKVKAFAAPAIRAFGSIGQGGGSAGETIGKFSETARSALESFRSILSSTVSIATSLWNTFGATLQGTAGRAIRNVLAGVRGGLRTLQGVFEVFAALLKGDWSGVWTGLKDIALGTLTSVKALVKQGLLVITTAFSLAGDALGALTHAAWEGIKTGTVRGIQALVTEVKALPGKILDALGDLSGLLVSVGKSIIDGLIKGIVSAPGAVADAVKGVLGGAVDAGKDLLHINSPSKVFEEMGKNVVEGFALGLSDTHRSSTAARGLMVDAISSPRSALVPRGRLDPAQFTASQGLRLASPDALRSNAGAGRMALTITNWDQGSGYIEFIADSRIDAASQITGMTHRAY